MAQSQYLVGVNIGNSIMSKIETNTIDTISGTTNLTIGSTNSSTVTFESGAVTGHMSPSFYATNGSTDQLLKY